MVASANVRLRLETVRLTALFNRTAAVREISLLFPAHTVTAIIGPSGCGKSTFLRCLNRMHELSESGWVTGSVLRENGRLPAASVTVAVERALRQAALWDEVHDRLDSSALALSGGQQQRLCIARALAPEPEVLLLDEPTGSLDPAGTQRIEELCHELKRRYTIVIVTHNLQQAARVSDYTAFFYLGRLIEVGRTAELFTKPAREETEAYLTGRFG